MTKKFLSLICICTTINGCDIMSDRLEEVGRVPQLSKVNVYEEPFHPINERVENMSRLSDLGYENGYTGDEIAVKGHTSSNSQKGVSANSIWRNDSRSFLKPYLVGDLLSVVVQIADQAKLDNKTQKSRSDSSNVGMPSMLGLETVVDNVLPGSSSASNIVSMKGNSSDSGSGKVDRKETIQTTIAVTVIRILPSGNLVVKGSQEVRVNFDVREVTIEGIVRPEDITMDNKVKLEQIAEARVSYGGRGQIFEYQQPPYAKQVLDVITPF